MYMCIIMNVTAYIQTVTIYYIYIYMNIFVDNFSPSMYNVNI